MVKAFSVYFFMEAIKMVVTFPPELERRIMALAALKRVDPAALVADLVAKELGDEIDLALANDAGHDEESDFDPEAGLRAVAALINRSPEQISAARERAIKEFKPARELPSDVSPLEVMPVIRGNETDEEVIQALRELS
jgi:hypothetical protein